MKNLMLVVCCGYAAGCSSVAGFDSFSFATDAGDENRDAFARDAHTDRHDASDSVVLPDGAVKDVPIMDRDAQETTEGGEVADASDATPDARYDAHEDGDDTSDADVVVADEGGADGGGDTADAGDAHDADAGPRVEIPCNGRDDNRDGEIDEGGGCWRRISDVDAPLPRSNHTMIATPRGEAVVWGGVTAGGRTATGGIYDPATDTWTATAETMAPAARYTHAASWVGNTMLVVGGYNGSSAEGSCGRLEVAANVWIPTAAAPATWDTAVTVVPEAQMAVVFGGMNPGLVGPIGRYHADRDVWLPMSGDGAPSARIGHIAVLDETRSRVVVWGGSDGGARSDGAIYDPIANAWAPMSVSDPIAPHNSPCGAYVAALDAVIVFGGSPGEALGALYFVGEDRWQIPISGVGAPVVEQCKNVSVWTGTELFVFVGDRERGALVGARYHPLADEWLPILAWPDSPPFRTGFTTALVAGGIMVWGGLNERDQLLGAGYIFTLVD